jgi:hypothetical protein
MNTIQYAFDTDTGTVWSRVGDQVAVPILDFAGMRPENNWQMNYKLEKMPVHELYGPSFYYLHWTKKLPLVIKNFHRKFWGMRPIKHKPTDKYCPDCGQYKKHQKNECCKEYA